MRPREIHRVARSTERDHVAISPPSTYRFGGEAKMQGRFSEVVWKKKNNIYDLARILC